MRLDDAFREGVKVGVALKTCVNTMLTATWDEIILSFRELRHLIETSKHIGEDEKKNWLSRVDESIWLTERSQLRPLDIHRLFESSLLV